MSRHPRTFGAFLVQKETWEGHRRALGEPELRGAVVGEREVTRDGVPVGIVDDGVARAGFATPSRRLEIWSRTLEDWGWPEHALPSYVESHLRHLEPGEMPLIPTFRLPTLIHTRSGNAKWLYELSNTNPLGTPSASDWRRCRWCASRRASVTS